MTQEIEIPEGYEARIERNKVIIELKESKAICQVISPNSSSQINDK